MKKFKFVKALAVILMLSLIIIGCSSETGYINNEDSNQTIEDSGKELLVHFIDVGQGDSILIQFPDGRISLIDGGTRSSAEKVVDYIDGLDIQRIDYLIATHPHEDHIGGLPDVIRNFDIGKIYMPKREATTKIFEELITEINNKGLKINVAKANDSIIDEDGLKFIILAPNSEDYSETNDFSVVTKLEYKNNSFIFTGDAEKDSEIEMINNNYKLKSDVLKVGHHGGSTSSAMEFLEEVEPEYSIISLGEDNTYGHPHDETMDRLYKIRTQVMRTDELGDIVIASDGDVLTVNGKNINLESNDEEKNNVEEEQYIGNKNTKVFHAEDCGSLPNEENQIIFNSYEKAIENGYKSHKQCLGNYNR